MEKLIRNHAKTLVQRFWEKVQKTDGCWIWTGATTQGYGVIRAEGPSRAMIRAPRLSYEIHVGPIPKGKHILHHCDNPPCTNPEHLFVGTSKDNAEDMVRKGRSTKGRSTSTWVARGNVHYTRRIPCAQVGQKNNGSKLTDKQVQEIRNLYAQGNISQSKLGKMFNVSQTAVGHILRRITWNHLS